MQVLIAEDDPVSRRLLEVTLRKWGYEVVVTCDGRAAWEVLQKPDAPPLAVLDWMLPEMDGLEICRKVRVEPGMTPPYLILLTSRQAKEDTVAGLEGGADDYVTKPFNPEELRARLRAGCRIISLQHSLAERVRQLEQSLAHIRRLHGLLPICAWCKKIRDDQNYWMEVDQYLREHSDIHFTHGICPVCMEKAKAELFPR